MSARTIMVQGTASSAGKSILVTALCRIFRQDGFRVAPFKAQNMALNSFVTPDGGELGRSTAVQAEACGTAAAVDMNPILLKPEADARCQVVVRGRPYANLSAVEYYALKQRLWPLVMDSLERLRAAHDVVVIEGAGSPAEVNLKAQDIVNMRVALAARSPVLLVADIDRGGVFASLVGTMELLEPPERALVKGFAINKFRGDVSLLRPGLEFLERRTGVPVIGVIPYLHDLRVADEDSVSLEDRRWEGKDRALLDIAVLRLPHISNFDDFDPLEAEPEVGLRMVTRPEGLGRPDLLILPGTKTTIADLAYLRSSGLAAAVLERAAAGMPVIGICGGYQMLGRRLCDPLHVESPAAEAPGLGLLPVDTVFATEKRTCRVTGSIAAGRGMLALARGAEVVGYEIHMGETTGEVAPAIRLKSRSDQQVDAVDGAVSENGLVLGTYVHGIFDQTTFRRALLQWLARRKNASLAQVGRTLSRDQEYDRLAAAVRESLDMALLYRILDPGGDR